MSDVGKKPCFRALHGVKMGERKSCGNCETPQLHKKYKNTKKHENIKKLFIYAQQNPPASFL